jgi:altronate dehydratase small subunit
MEKNVIVLHVTDNVATAINDLKQGDTIGVGNASLKAAENVPFGHKVALKAIPRGNEIIKYGETIGVALEDIAIGACVHVHNVESLRGRGDLPQ